MIKGTVSGLYGVLITGLLGFYARSCDHGSHDSPRALLDYRSKFQLRVRRDLICERLESRVLEWPC